MASINKNLLDSLNDTHLIEYPWRGKLQIDGKMRTVVKLDANFSAIHLKGIKNEYPRGSCKIKKMAAISFGEDFCHVARIVYKMTNEEAIKFHYTKSIETRYALQGVPNLVHVFAQVLTRNKHNELELVSYERNFQFGNLYTFESWYAEEFVLEKCLKIEIAQKIIATFAAMHQREIYHRDIKPENILCGEDPADPTKLAIAICDLDFCSIEGSGNKRRTGTPSYISPEEFIWKMNGPTKIRSKPELAKNDIWALGWTLHEIFNKLVRPLPFTDENYTQGMKTRAWLQQFDVSPSPLPRPEKKDRMEQLIWNMLQYEPDSRIEMQEALEEIEAIKSSERDLASQPAKSQSESE